MAIILFVLYLGSMAVSASALSIALVSKYEFQKLNGNLCLLSFLALICAVFGLCHHMAFPNGYIIKWTDPNAYDPANILAALFSLFFSIAVMVIVIKTLFYGSEAANNRPLATATHAGTETAGQSDSAAQAAAAAQDSPDQNDTILMIKDEFGLTDRETELCTLICEGKSNPDIASELFISENTVKTHIYNLFKKTNVSSRMELVALIGDHRTDA